jgi:hypothetical protein
MLLPTRVGVRPMLCIIAIASFFSSSVLADAQGDLPSETPPTFKTHTESFD